MPPEKHPPQRPTLEDLLRFKKAERPSPEFWAEFDRGLRKKQLAALVKQPQGWARVRPVMARSLRWAVPATAAAAVAMVVGQLAVSTARHEAPVAVASRTVEPISVPSGSAAPVASESTLRVVAAEHSDSAVVVAAAPVETRPAAVASAVPASHSLPWSAAALVETGPRATETVLAKAAPPRSSQNRSSWSSRYNSLAREVLNSRPLEPEFQLVSLESSLASSGELLATAPVLAADAPRSARAPAERDFRDLEARFGVSGSSLSFKF